jgi:WD40 repeat protein
MEEIPSFLSLLASTRGRDYHYDISAGKMLTYVFGLLNCSQKETTLQTFHGHSGPVTSLAFYTAATAPIVFSGSWDRTIRSFDIKVKKDVGFRIIDRVFNSVALHRLEKHSL